MLVGSITQREELEKVLPLVDLVEFRLDAFEIDSKPLCRSLFTVRKKEQGGLGLFTEAERLARIERLAALAPDFLDLEADTDPAFIEHIAKKFPRIQLIGSYHNFEKTPLDLPALLEEMRSPHFSLYKIACQAQSTLDMLRMMIFAKNSPVALSAISMGEFGKPSRVLGPIVGNAFDYAGLQEEPQLHRYSLQTLHETFRYRQLSRNTRIYGLIGDPIEQSPGHLFHNQRFTHDAVYIKMRLKKEELAPFFRLARQLPFGGLSVTRPLKEAVVAEIDEAEPIGALNTLVFREGKIYGYNTDGVGALNAIKKDLQGQRVAILGAGGTARAIAFEAKKRGARISIYNRTLERAKQLAQEVSGLAQGLESIGEYDLLINTIPNGPIPPLREASIILDVNYFPKETPLLIRAKEAGCICIYGEEMYVEQALLQQKIWSQ